jgi:hypothetical protein
MTTPARDVVRRGEADAVNARFTNSVVGAFVYVCGVSDFTEAA